MNETLDQFRRELTKWMSKFDTDFVHFAEEFRQDKEWNDFRIQYRAQCETTSNSHANIYLAYGQDIRLGEALGLFVERRSRVAALLGARVLPVVSPNSWDREAFGGGFEADKIGMPTFITLLDHIADGNISIKARVWPVVRLLGGTAAIATEKTRSRLCEVEGYDSSWWLEPAERVGVFTTVIKYEPWPRR